MIFGDMDADTQFYRRGGTPRTGQKHPCSQTYAIMYVGGHAHNAWLWEGHLPPPFNKSITNLKGSFFAMTNAKTTQINQTIFNIKDLLEQAEVYEQATSTREPNTCRLYKDGKLNINKNGVILANTNYTAKITANTLILFKDKNAKRRTNIRKDTQDIIFNLPAKLHKQQQYKDAVENSKREGFKEYLDYDIHTQELEGVEYHIINLAQYAEGQE